MKHVLFAFVCLGLAFVVARPDTSHSQDRPVETPSFFAALSVGQRVSVSSKESGYELNWFEGKPDVGTHTVVRLADDYVLLRDFSEVQDQWIPIYSIKSLKMIRDSGQ